MGGEASSLRGRVFSRFGGDSMKQAQPIKNSDREVIRSKAVPGLENFVHIVLFIGWKWTR